ncbi:DUF1190 domain-containing protein [uncultured Rhodoblastus sp.]|uniref:DUF1190 domain-containing protein n=1 Tax=uncultured Rhodoblastus sp. TaxID=543037 RepID=UPI0025D7D5D1|nr:DUF1190 domain-containing protein [uncultured Rhodoblastus sp.]
MDHAPSDWMSHPKPKNDPMKRLALGRLSTLAFLAVTFVPADASGQNAGKRIYSTISNCELAHVLTVDQCRNAHANALAELDEKSPRFASRTDCEKSFKHCMIAGFRGQRAEFEPALRGFEVNARSETDKTVLPILDGEGSSLGFRARTVLRMDTGISFSMHEQAQKRWAQVQNARAAAGAYGGDLDSNGGVQDSSAPNISPPQPMPPSENDLAAAAHRRQEIRNAPTVY